MKAIICLKYGSPEVFQIVEMAKLILKDNEVLIKIHPTTVAVANIRIYSFNVPPSVWIFAQLVLGITKPRNLIIGVEVCRIN